MHWKAEFQEALNIIHEIEVPMEFCPDKRLGLYVHNPGRNDFQRHATICTAISHYNHAIKIAQEINNME